MILRSTFFQKSATPPKKTKQVAQKMTISESVLPEKIRDSNERPGDDFTLFPAYPLVEIARDIYTCLDPGFLVEKAGRGLFWTISSALQSKQKNRLLSFWGAVFEVYVNSIMRQSYKARGRYLGRNTTP